MTTYSYSFDPAIRFYLTNVYLITNAMALQAGMDLDMLSFGSSNQPRGGPENRG